ncbi:flagellar assembly protein FliW [Radiobacillus kanasensis]|uniref:flagellar assembly protein FliW n=1 Tax=Radiobacillus kanasensis TaxID=2844358 RepID=UPI001E442EE9|nr:flagellar assembly protein FliW [Radiobacillus kanasensis]UFT98546.1 flagellar assembly protein FliW [Radiobacillus kanasensis]
MKIITKFFGEITIKEEDILTFPHGLPGFSEEKAFVLLPIENNPIFQVLQSTKGLNPAFIVVNPYHFKKDYEFVLDSGTVELLQIKTEKDVEVIAIASLKELFEESTVNLQAPIVVNQKEKLAKQFITNSSEYSTKETIFTKKTLQVKED